MLTLWLKILSVASDVITVAPRIRDWRFELVSLTLVLVLAWARFSKKTVTKPSPKRKVAISIFVSPLVLLVVVFGALRFLPSPSVELPFRDVPIPSVLAWSEGCPPGLSRKRGEFLSFSLKGAYKCSFSLNYPDPPPSPPSAVSFGLQSSLAKDKWTESVGMDIKLKNGKLIPLRFRLKIAGSEMQVEAFIEEELGGRQLSLMSEKESTQRNIFELSGKANEALLQCQFDNKTFKVRIKLYYANNGRAAIGATEIAINEWDLSFGAAFSGVESVAPAFGLSRKLESKDFTILFIPDHWGHKLTY